MTARNRIQLGIVQGRLILGPTSQLQWFPQDYWEGEFFLANSLGIEYIELIAERKHNPNNPLWTNSRYERIIELASRNNLLLHSFCNDYVIDHTLFESEVLQQNLHLIERGALLGCKKYILPLFEKSELTVENLEQYKAPIIEIANKASDHGVTVCLETNLCAYELLKALDILNHPGISVVYDTGNRVALGHDLVDDIRILGNKITHVHIKDKNSRNENVLLGTGLVNFLEVFRALKEINYSGFYTFETHRGKNPLRTARHNINFVRFFQAEGFET